MEAESSPPTCARRGRAETVSTISAGHRLSTVPAGRQTPQRERKTVHAGVGRHGTQRFRERGRCRLTQPDRLQTPTAGSRQPERDPAVYGCACATRPSDGGRGPPEGCRHHAQAGSLRELPGDGLQLCPHVEQPAVRAAGVGKLDVRPILVVLDMDSRGNRGGPWRPSPTRSPRGRKAGGRDEGRVTQRAARSAPPRGHARVGVWTVGADEVTTVTSSALRFRVVPPARRQVSSMIETYCPPTAPQEKRRPEPCVVRGKGAVRWPGKRRQRKGALGSPTHRDREGEGRWPTARNFGWRPSAAAACRTRR